MTNPYKKCEECPYGSKSRYETYYSCELGFVKNIVVPAYEGRYCRLELVFEHGYYKGRQDSREEAKATAKDPL